MRLPGRFTAAGPRFPREQFAPSLSTKIAGFAFVFFRKHFPRCFRGQVRAVGRVEALRTKLRPLSPLGSLQSGLRALEASCPRRPEREPPLPRTQVRCDCPSEPRAGLSGKSGEAALRPHGKTDRPKAASISSSSSGVLARQVETVPRRRVRAACPRRRPRDPARAPHARAPGPGDVLLPSSFRPSTGLRPRPRRRGPEHGPRLPAFGSLRPAAGG